MEALDAESPSRRLRAATAVLHQRVEDGVDLFRNAETKVGYAELLIRMEAFYAGFEPALFRALPTELPEEFRFARVDRLREDLDVVRPGWTPRAPIAPDGFESDAHALGGLYVVEGAALGGQLIARFLLARHGYSASRGASFFASAGNAVGPRWRAVRDVLDTVGEYEAVEAGAKATFLLFEQALVASEASLA